MAGRPKRDSAVLRALLAREFEWQIAFCGLREGLPECDTSLLNSETAGLKWSRPRSSILRTEDENAFWQKHYADHLKEADKEFTDRIVLAAPRDVPSELKLWKALSDPQVSVRRVRSICAQSRVLRFLFGNPSFTPLYRYAREFCRAKKDKRYPSGGKQRRLSSDEKQVDYLARVMAGLSLRKRIAPATAVDILRKMRHKKFCQCVHCYIRRFNCARRTQQGSAKPLVQCAFPLRPDAIRVFSRARAARPRTRGPRAPFRSPLDTSSCRDQCKTHI